MVDLTYHVYKDFVKGSYVLGDFKPENLPAVAGELEVVAMPDPFPASISTTFILHLFTVYPTVQDLSTGVGKIFARPLESPISEVLLDTGSVSGNELTVDIPKDTVPGAWNVYPKVRFTFEVQTAGDEKIRVYQDVVLTDTTADVGDDEFGSIDAISNQNETLIASATLDNRPGWRSFLLDASGGSYPVTLPLAGTYPGQRITLIKDASGNDVTLNPNTKTINDVAGNQTLTDNDTLDLYEFGGNWWNLNPTVIV